jgi:hypothetical protein
MGCDGAPLLSGVITARYESAIRLSLEVILCA